MHLILFVFLLCALFVSRFAITRATDDAMDGWFGVVRRRETSFQKSKRGSALTNHDSSMEGVHMCTRGVTMTFFATTRRRMRDVARRL